MDFFLLGFLVDARDISNYVTCMEDHPSFIEQAISYDVLISSYELNFFNSLKKINTNIFNY